MKNFGLVTSTADSRLIRLQPINGDGVHEPDTGLQLIPHRVELELAQLREFLPRLGRYFDHGHDGSQIEMLQRCLGRLSAKKVTHGYYSVAQRGRSPIWKS